jgi:hypothetical protein
VPFTLTVAGRAGKERPVTDHLEVPGDATTTPLVTHTVRAEPVRVPQAGKPTCRGMVKATGAPCRGMATASGFCPMHDPARQQEIALARQRGGHTTQALTAKAKEYGITLADSVEVVTPAGVQHVLAETIKGVSSGRLSAAAGTAIASLARVAVDAAQAQVEADMKDLLAKANELAEGQRR